MFGLSTAVLRVIVGLGFALCILAFLQVRSCEQARQKAAQSRVDQAQSEAAISSAKDAIATQGASAAAEKASDAMTQSNSKEIHDAEGAATPVPPAVNAAGLASLCRRPAYRDSERCRLLAASAR